MLVHSHPTPKVNEVKKRELSGKTICPSIRNHTLDFSALKVPGQRVCCACVCMHVCVFVCLHVRFLEALLDWKLIRGKGHRRVLGDGWFLEDS